MSKHGPLSDETFQGKMRNRQKAIEAQKKKDLSDLMHSGEGRRFFYDLLFNRCNLTGVYMGQDSGIYRHEGRRMLAVELAQQIQDAHPDMWVLMVREYLDAQANEALIKGAAESDAKKEEDDG